MSLTIAEKDKLASAAPDSVDNRYLTYGAVLPCNRQTWLRS